MLLSHLGQGSACLLSSTPAVQALRPIIAQFSSRCNTSRGNSVLASTIGSSASCCAGTCSNTKPQVPSQARALSDGTPEARGRRSRHLKQESGIIDEYKITGSRDCSKRYRNHQATLGQLEQWWQRLADVFLRPEFYSRQIKKAAVTDVYKAVCFVAGAPGPESTNVITVHNAEETSADNRSPTGKAWLTFLEVSTGIHRSEMKCAVEGCYNPVSCGAHVQLGIDATGVRFSAISHFCADHNLRKKHPASEVLILKEGAQVVLIPPHYCWNLLHFMEPVIEQLIDATPPTSPRHLVVAANYGGLGAVPNVEDVVQRLVQGQAEQLSKGLGVFLKANMRPKHGVVQTEMSWALATQLLAQPRGSPLQAAFI